MNELNWYPLEENEQVTLGFAAFTPYGTYYVIEEVTSKLVASFLASFSMTSPKLDSSRAKTIGDLQELCESHYKALRESTPTHRVKIEDLIKQDHSTTQTPPQS